MDKKGKENKVSSSFLTRKLVSDSCTDTGVLRQGKCELNVLAGIL